MLAEDSPDQDAELRPYVLPQRPVDGDVAADGLDQLLSYGAESLVAQDLYRAVRRWTVGNICSRNRFTPTHVGKAYKVWVLLEGAEETPADSSDENDIYTVPASAENSVQTSEDEVYTGADELTALKTENKGLRELADYHREQLRDSEWRYRELMEQLKLSQTNVATLTRALPAAEEEENRAHALRSWWLFGKGRG